MHQTAPAMIDARNVTVRYGQRVALRHASLRVRQGRIAAIIGPSGCGKSSFLMTLNRLTDLIPGAHVEGSIRIDGQQIIQRAADLVALRRSVGMIFQKPNPLPMSIRRNIQLALQEHGVRGRSQRESIMQSTLEQVGLWQEVKDRLNASALGLSGGQQQRLCIARALALQPRVLLMDEPCSALDPIAAGRVESLIDRLREHYTVVLVTHHLAQARRLADDVAMFWIENDAGVILEQGPADEFFAEPQHPTTQAYLAGMQG